ncbi:hypothetical protein [Kitasatospora sp. GP82]|uniref:hypothetical protein n=1 Tax=Kitasatospora sp. GP82 TaxID=3035089 RepID=UPI0024734541|nr:hypothetical protein [Kitasatospora sp. GP82]MDH6126530.1 hypothetical protein [Kitasatospora sp. GP82]
MTVLGAFHTPAHIPTTRTRGSAHAVLVAIVRRLVDSPLDHTVMRTLGGPGAGQGRRPAHPTVRMHAGWRTVTTQDGTRRLGAHWDPDR